MEGEDNDEQGDGEASVAGTQSAAVVASASVLVDKRSSTRSVRATTGAQTGPAITAGSFLPLKDIVPGSCVDAKRKRRRSDCV